MRISSIRLFLALTLCASQAGLTHAKTGPDAAHTLRLTPAEPSTERRGVIVAPGSGQHGYNVFYIDTRDFRSGGILDIDIQIAPNSATYGAP